MLYCYALLQDLLYCKDKGFWALKVDCDNRLFYILLIAVAPCFSKLGLLVDSISTHGLSKGFFHGLSKFTIVNFDL